MKKIYFFLTACLLCTQVFAGESQIVDSELVSQQSVGLYIDVIGKGVIAADICLETTNDFTCGNLDKTINSSKIWRLNLKYNHDIKQGDESCTPYLFWQFPEHLPQRIKMYLKVEKRESDSRPKKTIIYFSDCVLA